MKHLVFLDHSLPINLNIDLGTVASGSGITLAVIGKNKANQYEQLMKNDQKQLSLNMTNQRLIPIVISFDG